MTRGEPWITDDEKDEIRQVIKEQKLFGFTNEEGAKICGERLHKKFGLRESITKKTYENIKLDEANRDELTNWMTVYTKIGYLDAYKQWIEKTLFVEQKLLKLFDHLTSKPMDEQERLSGKINSTARSIRETVILHSSLGLGAPMILQMKNAIDKGLVDEFLPERELKRIQESGQESREDIPSDEFSA